MKKKTKIITLHTLICIIILMYMLLFSNVFFNQVIRANTLFNRLFMLFMLVTFNMLGVFNIKWTLENMYNKLKRYKNGQLNSMRTKKG